MVINRLYLQIIAYRPFIKFFSNKSDIRAFLRGKAGNHPVVFHEVKADPVPSAGKIPLGPGNPAKSSFGHKVQKAHEIKRMAYKTSVKVTVSTGFSS